MYMPVVSNSIIYIQQTCLFAVSEELDLIPFIVGENSSHLLLINQLHTMTIK